MVALFIGALPQAATAAAPTVTDVIATIAVKGRAPKTGYTRAQFGPAWELSLIHI